MAHDTTEASFKITVEKKETWKTVTETSGTDSPATRMSFFIAMPLPALPQESSPPVQTESRRD